MRKICVVTGTRAEFGLLYWVLKGIEADPTLQLQLCVTGMHLSPEFGLTFKEIEAAGFFIDSKVEMLLSSDTEIGISKSVGLGVIGFSDALNNLKPDILLILGDRFEIFAAAIAAMIARIPIAHCHGGETTEGVIDEAVRHAITKMSHMHFTSTEDYRRRVMQLGESRERVFNVGALGIENINRMKLLSKDSFEDSIQFKLAKHNFLVTFHPVTLENATAEEQFFSLLKALNNFPDANIIFTKPNADTNGRIIIKIIDEYVKIHPEKSIAFISLGQLRYLSALQYVDLVIGNSSSGLLEAPSFKIATINIGDRQKGRISAESVIDCKPTEHSITDAIKKAMSDTFKTILTNVKNPYGTKNASDQIIQILKEVSLDGILKKQFNDIK